MTRSRLVLPVIYLCLSIAFPVWAGAEEHSFELRERLEALEQELKWARQTGNTLEVEEIQELMARLNSQLADEARARGPHVSRTDIYLDGDTRAKTSSSSCGFALAYSDTAASQLAVMQPAGMLVGSLGADEVITLVIRLARVGEAFKFKTRAELGEGREASIGLAQGPARPRWRRIENTALALNLTGYSQNGSATLMVQMKCNQGPASIRLTQFELDTEGKTHALTLPIESLSIERFPRPELPLLRPAIERALIEWDWRMQDGIGTERAEGSFDQAIQDLLQRGDTLIKHLEQTGIPMLKVQGQWRSMRQQWRRLRVSPNISKPAWETLWRKVHRRRRQMLLQNPLTQTGPIAFVKCVPTNNSIMQQQYIGRFARPAGGIFVLEEPGKSMRCRDLTGGKLPHGAFQHLDVSSDGTRICFAFCKLNRPPEDAHQGNPDHQYNIYEIQTDGHGLKPLVVSAHDDISPRYLPDGRIAFMSTRRGGYSRCGPDYSPCHTLALAAADGSDQRLISFHEIHEYDPAVMNDGRIIYTRWDYVDREASLYQQLWVTRPDGTNPAIFYGNNTFNPMATFESRAVPGSQRIMAIAGCHHSIAAGSVVLVDVTKGVDGPAPIQRLTPDVLFPETETSMQGAWTTREDGGPIQARRWPHHSYKSPLPLSEDIFLAAYSFDRLVYIETEPNPANMFGLYLCDRFGNKELLYRDLNVCSLWPMPIRVRSGQNELPDRVDPQAPKEGTFYVQNMYAADPRLPVNVPIKRLRIIHVYPRTSEIEMYPVIGIPTAACGRQVLGTVPVEADGSAFFKAPAGISLAFQALDALGQSVQFMRSVTYLQPGEDVSCIGCHEHRMSAPTNLPMGLALRRGPSVIEPGPEGSKPLSYPLLVQPVLDRHCVECHGGARMEGDVVLTGRAPESPDGERAVFSVSYLELAPLVRYAQWGALEEGQDFRVSNSEPITQPGFFGARSSPLIALLRQGHAGVKLSNSDFERLVTWADTNVLFYGTFDPADQARQLKGERIEGPLVD